jgi:guanylate kinase
VIAGPGGVGKGTIVREITANDPTLELARSWTTRPQRRGEANDAYTFVDRPTFLAKIADDGFFEWNELASNGHLYGTPRAEATGPRDVVLEIDVAGAQQVLQRVPDALVIYIEAPSDDALRERMKARGDTPEEIEARVALGRRETQLGRDLASAVVVNEDLGRSIDEVTRILAKHRSSTE